MIVNREGRFRARIADKGIAESGQNKLTTWSALFALTEELAGDGWTDIEDEDLTIQGYFYLEKKDGSLNMFAVEAIKDAVGWDGKDLCWLQDADNESLPQVQLAIANEEYQGKWRMKVQYLNPFDATGPIGKTSDDGLKDLNNKLGSKLRAMSGGSSAAPAKSKSDKPKRSSKKAPKVPKKDEPELTVDDAWSSFVDLCIEKDVEDQETQQSHWFALIRELFGDKDEDNLSAKDLERLLELAPTFIPAKANDDNIPF